MGTSRSRWAISLPFSRRGSGETINLRQKLYVRYPLEVLAGIGVIIVVVFLMRSAFTKAEVTTFNPATCLGTWQNPSAAQGTPETFGVEGAVPSAENSAVYTATPSYIFCGNFLPPGSEFEATGTIQSVGLTFVWDIRDESRTPSSSVEVPSGTGPTSTDESPVANPPTSFRSTPFSLLVRPVFAQEAPVGEPAPTPAPIPEPSAATATPPLEEPPAPMPDAPAQTPEEPAPSQAPLDVVTAPEATSTEATSTASTTEVVTYEPPAPPADTFLKVSYTLNGTTWFELSRVNLSNWPNLTVSIPIVSWDELANLQVSVEEIGTTLLPPYPKVFLDGMFLEVTYERPVPPEEATGGAVLTNGDGSGEPTPEEPINIVSDIFGNFIEEPAAPLVETGPDDAGISTHGTVNTAPRSVNPEARHACSFTPFSLGVRPKGPSASFTMTLVPSRPNAPFEIEIGNLPAGVTANINRASGVGTLRPRVALSAEQGAVPGSYTITVFYNEAQNGGGTLTSACKLNLIVE